MATTSLETLVDQTISVITNDGRNIVGILKGFDQATNLILDESHERVYSTKAGVEQLVLGLYIIRGDNIAVVGELDEELDASLDFDQVVAAFKAKWCGSCRLMAPSFVELSKKHLQVVFITVDVDELPDITAQWNVQGLPTFVLIKDKKEIERIVGGNKEELDKKLVSHVQQPPPNKTVPSKTKK